MNFFCCYLTCLTLIIGFPAINASAQTPSNSATLADSSETAGIETDEVTKQRLAKLLREQTKSWNDGDLVGFMQTYWKSDQLTFSGGGLTTRGWQATLERYQKNYSPPKEMGKLNFDELEITLLPTESALVLGNWHLTLANNQHRRGNFSLVVRKIDGEWKIIHDHSSELKAETERSTND